MIAEIHRHELTQYSEHGEPLAGDVRCLRRLPRRIYTPDAEAIAAHGSAAAAVTAYLRTLEQGFVLASAAPGPVPGVLSHTRRSSRTAGSPPAPPSIPAYTCAIAPMPSASLCSRR